MRTLLVIVSVLMVLAPTAASAEKRYVMKLATLAPDNTPWSELIKHYKRAVEARSGGRVIVKAFLGGTLGDELEMLLKCRRGQVEAAGVSTIAIATVVPEVTVADLPFLFRSHEEVDRVFDEVFRERFAKIFPRYGLAFGFFSENGFRHFWTKGGFVTSPRSLTGLKMRSAESPIHLATYRALGASPVPLPATETLMALKTGVVDGYDQGIVYAIATGWSGTTSHLTLTDHAYVGVVITFNRDWFAKLPPDLQKIIVEAGRALEVNGNAAIRRMNPKLVEVAKGMNVTVHTLTPEERRALEKATLPVRDELRRTHGKAARELLDAVEKKLAELRRAPGGAPARATPKTR